ncbi:MULTISPECIES: translation initiation factor IF-2 [unclassified Caulobacter]|uniref:translation initiation factor IF-2 n=1 Tax=unclassified Caulobacter TaxID=2648921 RepID=UPI0006F60CDD|nr:MULTISPECIES: translation initiation factor IF-2 [unclassified Caulobacter]KQV62225.1 translation initiation factor IF-2 [Caulobacter sp. Root342]KQV63145.1 translation initiation factor IF-2 [Caulobacter sp. Root343]
MSDENENGRPGGRAPITLKPRQGSVSAGVVKQSFSHGRTKTVVVETKRTRSHAPASGNLAAPSSAERRHDAPPQRPQQSHGGGNASSGGGGSAGGLSQEELRARQRAIESARETQARQAADQAAAEARARAAQDAAQREVAAKASAERAASAPAPVQAPVAQAPVAQAPAASAPAPAAPVTPPPAAPVQPAAQAPAAPRAEAPRQEAPRQEAPRHDASRQTGAAQTGAGQTRTYEPSRERRDDRPTTTTYRPAPQSPFNQRSPRPDAGANFGQRAPRPEGDRPRGPRPEGDRPQGDRPQGDRGGYRGDRPQGDRPQGDRPQQTVRYSALAPRPAPGGPRGPGGPGGPRGPRPGVPAAAPATPEVQRAMRSAPRPGGEVSRRPDDEDDRRKAAAPGKAVSRAKGAPVRREGRLTIQAVAGDGDSADRMRSLASVRRAREREKEKRRGGPAEVVKVSREVVIPDVITVQELSNRMAVRGVDIIKFLMRQGVMLKINDVIDNDTAELVATEFGHTVKRVSEADVEEGFIGADDHDDHLEPRPPVVTIMGHVDHGKTSLLDALRATDVAAGEHGGITQHIGAYQVRLKDGQRVTFLDTPGHAAFSSMRARGANITDIVVLVVAGDDGVMPQTIEAIKHAKAADVPIIVAVNKMDKPGSDSTRVVNELLQHEIVVESLGGDTQLIEVSAKARTGLDELLEGILLQAEVLDLKANPDRTADGVVIEAKLDKGRGAVSTVLVNRGTLKRGDIVVAGSQFGRVRALLNERNEQLTEAGPATPVEILGLDGVPSPGEAFAVVENEARARELTEYRIRQKREKSMAPVGAGASMAEMMAKLQDKKLKELPLVIKSDVQGSAEAILGSLDKMSTDEVRARIILSGAGAISESDVMLAKGAGAPVIGFNVRASAQARALAEREGVEIRYYAIIYDLLDDIKGVLSGMLAPIQRETFLGNAEVLQAFDISKIGRVAGCKVTEGVVRKGAKVRIVRQDIVVLELGTLQTLKRFKDEVNEVPVGQECGMMFAGFQDIKVGDVIECFTVEEIKRQLD